jgi:hypothetical protein
MQQNTQMPPMPGSPAPTKKHHWARNITLGIIAAIVLIAVLPDTNKDTAPVTSSSTTTTAPVSDEAVLRATLATHPALVAQFCDPYRQLIASGVPNDRIFQFMQSGNGENVFDSFSSIDLPDREIFDTITSYC